MTRHSLGIVLVLLIACAALRGEQPKRSKKRWLLSMAAGVADNALELRRLRGESLLRSADGWLRSRGVAVKFGLLGTTAGLARWLVRCHPESAPVVTCTNYAAAGAIAIAVRNYRVRGPWRPLARAEAHCDARTGCVWGAAS